MIDPAVIDLMHHMSTAPTAIEQPFAAIAGARGDVDVGEEPIQRLEAITAKWLRSADIKFRALLKEYHDVPIDEQRLRYLDQMIESFEAQLDTAARHDRRHVKVVRRVVKHQKARSGRHGAIAGMQGSRALYSVAQTGEFKQEAIFALRALRSELNGSARSGPTFSDPDEMISYLRAAIA